MLQVVSYFRQVYVFLVIETVGQSKPEGAWVLLSEILSLQCNMNMSSDEDYYSSLLSFVNRFVDDRCLDGGYNTFCNEIEFHVFNPLQIVSSRDL
ncbi:hypothetical protein ACFX1X_006195 [Malus domestica]